MLGFGTSAGAFAHAFLSTAVPAVGAAVTAPPEIRITFTEPVEPAFSAIEVADAAGRPVGAGHAGVDPGNPMQLVLPLPALPPGHYKVSWHVVSVDTHRTEGQYGFEIRP